MPSREGGNHPICLDCQSPMSLQQAKALIDQTGKSPRCERCGGLVKSAVISFGQAMPQDKVVDAERLAMSCDLFVVLGSSLVVHPAAGLPIIAKNNGSKLVIINNQPTPLDPIADFLLPTAIGPTLQKALEKSVLGRQM